jgi:hypothetical protein
MKSLFASIFAIILLFVLMALFILNIDKLGNSMNNKDKSTIYEYEQVENVLNFKMTGYKHEYQLVFKKSPNIDPNASLKMSYISDPGYVELYINDQLAYGKDDDVVFKEIYRDNKDGSISRETVIANKKI